MSRPALQDKACSYVLALLRTPSGRRCWVDKRTKDAGAVLTHTFMDSTCTGMVSVPASMTDEWNAAVAKDVAAGTLPAINELRTPHVFAFFVDFDCKLRTAEALRVVTARGVARVCIESVGRFLPTRRDLRVIVAVTPDRPADEPGTTKRGLHLYFPHVVVTAHEALLMREATIVLLERFTREVDWAADFDSSVYVGNRGGLRMLGAPKAKKCDACHNLKRDRAACNACLRTGHELLPLQRYAVGECLDREGRVDAEITGLLQRNAAACMRACTVRTTAQAVSPDWACFPGCPSYPDMKSHKRGPPTAGDAKRKFKEEAASLRKVKWPKTTVADVQKVQCIRDIFRTRFHPVYKNVDISQVSYLPKTKTYYAQFSGEGENFCLNKMDRHSSNRVYGVIQGLRAFIKCHCQCPKLEGRVQNRFCRDFESQSQFITPADARILAADEVEQVEKVKAASAPSADCYLFNVSQTLFQANNL